MKILVAGSRTFSDVALMARVLGQAQRVLGPFDHLIHGAAKGADVMAGDWACAFGIPVIRYPADWDRYNRSAGPIRNTQMLTEGKPDVCIVFFDGEVHESHGSRDMFTKARSARVNTFQVVHGTVYTSDGHLAFEFLSDMEKS